MILLLLVAGVGYGAYRSLPTATITITPRRPSSRRRRSRSRRIRTLPSSMWPQASFRRRVLEIPVSVSGTFPATGIETRETRATGDGPFPKREHAQRGGGRGRHGRGHGRRHADSRRPQAAIIPRADFATSTPGTVDVPVRAARPGRAATWPRVRSPACPRPRRPAGQRPQSRPDHGGRRIEERVVQQSDWDAARDAARRACSRRRSPRS